MCPPCLLLLSQLLLTLYTPTCHSDDHWHCWSCPFCHVRWCLATHYMAELLFHQVCPVCLERVPVDIVMILFTVWNCCLFVWLLDIKQLLSWPDTGIEQGVFVCSNIALLFSCCTYYSLKTRKTVTGQRNLLVLTSEFLPIRHRISSAFRYWRQYEHANTINTDLSIT